MKNLIKQPKSIFEVSDKSNWNVLKFDDIASNISERAEPQKTDAKIYVGLEHLDSNSIHIRRYGKPADVKGTKLKVYKGDVIFGKRRAYQRKAALAEFDGICSAHAMVLRANPENMDPRLFPFFIHSEIFMSRALQVSEGSLSPTIKWKILKDQKFTIPPLATQKEMVKLLEAMDKNIEAKLDSLNKTLITQASLLYKFFKDDNTTEKPLGLFIREYRNGFAEGSRDSDGVFQIRMNNITKQGNLDFTESAFVPKRKGYENFLLKKNDVLFNNTNSPDLVGKSALWNEQIKEAVFSNHFTRLRTEESTLLPKYLHLWLTLNFTDGEFKRRCVRWVNQASVKSDDLLSMKISVPSIKIQLLRLEKFEQLEILAGQLESSIEKTRELLFSLNNNIYEL